jgi:hypothetical protein
MEQTGNVYENKRPMWKTKAIPEHLSTGRQTVKGEAGYVKEHYEARQRKTDG